MSVNTINNTQGEKNSKCNLCDGNPEVLGWYLDAMCRGVTVMGSAIFMSVAILGLAKEAAGCESEDEICDGRVYGMKPTSVITNIMVAAGLAAATCMPFLGAIIDHTNYRRAAGRISAAILTLLVFMQIFISERNWFFMTVLQVFVAFSYCVHSVMTFAYLPETTNDPKKLASYSASFQVAQYCACVTFLVFMLVTTIMAGLDSVKAARVSSIFIFCFCVLCFGYSWTCLFGERKATQKVPDGSSVVTAGFKKLYRTVCTISSSKSPMKWLLVAIAFSDAGNSSFNSMAVTYMTIHLQLNTQEIGFAIFTLLIFSIPGSQLSALVTKKWNAVRSLQCALVLWLITTSIAVLVLDGPGKQMEAYICGIGWGLSTGWLLPTERTAFCQILPIGQETELMGLYLCFCSSLVWLPPLIFSAMNEAGIDMRLCFASLNIFFFTSFCLLCCIGDFTKAVEVDGRNAKSTEIIDTVTIISK